jgi:shikimate kinase
MSPTRPYIRDLMSIVLIGYRGSGKTTVGQILARRLGKLFVDSDPHIVNRAGKTIKEIFEQDGETSFRQLESAVVKELAGLTDHVIAVGGGALDRHENRDAIVAGKHRVILLSCHPPELLRRIRSDPATAAARPNLTALAGGIEEIEAVLARRLPVWRGLASVELDVTQLSPEQAAQAIERLL